MTPTSKDLIIFTLENHMIGVGISDVDEVILPIEVKPLPIGLTALIGLFRIRQKICPLVNIAKLLELQPSQAIEDERRILILNSTSQTFGIAVDRVSDIMTISEEHILNTDEVIDTLPYIKHVVMTQDKKTIHVLDVEALISILITKAQELFTLQS